MKRLLLILLMCTVIPLAPAATLFDNFESYETGAVDDMASPPWFGNSANIVYQDWNYVLDNDDDVYAELGSFAIPNSDTQTTVFFRVYSEDCGENSLIGVADEDDTSPDSYGDMDCYIQFVSGDLRSRSGSSTEKLIEDAEPGWYNVWLVINNSADTYDVYINRTTADATAEDKFGSNFGFRTPSDTPIVSFANVYGDGLTFDDVYITPGLDLTNPPKQAMPPVVDSIDGRLFDQAFIVENGGFSLPGFETTGLTDVPGWTDTNAPYSSSTGTVDDENNTDGDGWFYNQDIRTSGDNGPLWNITAVPMVEGETYTFTADVQGRWDCDGVTMSIITGPYTGSDPEVPVGSGDPNVALASNAITVGGNDLYYPGTVTYTATAADAGNYIGVKFQGTSTTNIDNSWMRIDNVHLYTDYLEIHGPEDPSPANEAENVAPASMTLSWTPSNDPNITGQELYYYVGNQTEFPNIEAYNAEEKHSLSATDNFYNIGAVEYDSYVMWRVDSVMDSNSYTGQTWYFMTQPSDFAPIVTAGPGWLTWVGGTMPSLYADVDDLGEGDIDNANVVWTVEAPWDPVDSTVMQMYDRSGDSDLAAVAGSGYDPNLLEDWIGSDVRGDNWICNPFVLTLSGIPGGTYTWTSYHHDPGDQTGPFDVTVIDSTGSAATTGIDQSAGGEVPVTVFTTTITSDGSDIKLIYENTGLDNSTQFFVMNGFVLSDGVNSDLAVDFGTPTNGIGIDYQAYTAEHEVAATFVEQYFDALGVTGIGVLPQWGPGNAYGATVSAMKTSSDPLAPTADFYANYPGDYTVTITATDNVVSQSEELDYDSDTLVVRVAPDACAAATTWSGGSFNYYDSDEDCDVDIVDFAAFAAQWLDNVSLDTPVEE